MASLLQACYGIRSERLRLEQLHYNLLFGWFVGLSPDDPIWHLTTFAKTSDRLFNDDHFSVDGTLLQAWASYASLKRIDAQEDTPLPPTGSGEGFGAPKEGSKRAKGDFRGIKLSNETRPEQASQALPGWHPRLPNPPHYLGLLLPFFPRLIHAF